MNRAGMVRKWLEAGKQIGRRYSLERAGETHWADVAVQKHGDVYKLYTSSLPESHWATPEDAQEEIIEVVDIDNLADLVAEKTGFQLTELAPLKGARVFDPAFEHG